MSIIKGTNKIVAGFGGTKRSIGEVYFSQSSLATDNSGALPLFTGETIASANTIYPDFYNWVSSHTELQCTSEEYESVLTTYGECAKYVIGSGSLRLPKKALSHGTVIKEKKPTDTDHTWYRQWSDGWLEQGGEVLNIPANSGVNITFLKPFANTLYTALCTPNNTTSDRGDKRENWGLYKQDSTSCRMVNNSETKTVTFSWYTCGQGADGAQEETLYPWVVAYAAAIPASTAQAAEFQRGLSGKVDLADGVTNDNVDYVVDSYNDANGNWYRVYKSGWVEQGGFFGTATGDWASVTFTYLKPFQNTNYQLFCLGNWNSPASSSCRVTAKSTTSATVTYANNTTNVQLSVWRACGQGTAPTGTGEVFSSTLSTSQTPVLLHLDGNNANSGTAGMSWVGNSFSFVSAGKFGQCAKLNGYYDFRGLNFSETDKYTVEYWAGASEDNAGTYFTWGTGSGPSAILSIAINHGKNEFIIKQGDNTIAYQSGLSSSVDKWHHTAFVYHGDSTFTFFIDGKKVDYTLSASGATSVYNCIFNGESGKSLYDEFVVHNYERYTKDFKLQTTPYTLA